MRRKEKNKGNLVTLNISLKLEINKCSLEKVF